MCEKTELLLNNGASITVKDAQGKTAVHLAFNSNQINIIDLILSKYSNGGGNPADNGGLSHFHISCTKEHTKPILDFFQNGVDINRSVNFDSTFWPGYTPLVFVRFLTVSYYFIYLLCC